MLAFGVVSVPDLGHSNSVLWCLLVVLICIFLMSYDAKHSFHVVIYICLSSLTRCLLRSCLYFLRGWFVIVEFKSSLCMLDNSSLSNVSFVSIFSQSMACLLLYWLCLLLSRAVNSDEVQLIIISFMDHTLGIVSKNSSPYRFKDSFSSVIHES